MSQPVIRKMIRRNGIGGQTQFTVDLDHDDEGLPKSLSFVGNSTYGGPVVVITDSGMQAYVTDPDRFGPFGESWVRQFILGPWS